MTAVAVVDAHPRDEKKGELPGLAHPVFYRMNNSCLEHRVAMKKRWLALTCVVMLGLVLAPAAAQDQTAPETVWGYTGMDRFTPACPPELGATVKVAGNQLTYTYTYPEDPHNPWVMRFTWEDPVLRGAKITAKVEGQVMRRGSPAGPTPSVRMLMYTAPSAYQVKYADVGFSGAIGTGVPVGDNFEAHANPDPNWTTPFHVGVWFSAHYCDTGDREVARYHFRRDGVSEDSDDDGVPHAKDRCPKTRRGAAVNTRGCSIAQLCPCNKAWKSHADYVRCFAHYAENFKVDGLINDDEEAAIVEHARKSSCGVPDIDEDGVLDNMDACPKTPRGAAVDLQGCSIAQLCPCDKTVSGTRWDNHAQYVKCVVRKAQEFWKNGLISESEREDFIIEAVLSPCGKRK
jgi:hypothetical protein